LTFNKIYAKKGHMMKRTNIFATEKQLNQLHKMARKTGLPMAEIIRRAIDDYLLGANSDTYSHLEMMTLCDEAKEQGVIAGLQMVFKHGHAVETHVNIVNLLDKLNIPESEYGTWNKETKQP